MSFSSKGRPIAIEDAVMQAGRAGSVAAGRAVEVHLELAAGHLPGLGVTLAADRFSMGGVKPFGSDAFVASPAQPLHAPVQGGGMAAVGGPMMLQGAVWGALAQVMSATARGGEFARLDTRLASLALQQQSPAVDGSALSQFVPQAANAFSVGSNGKLYVTVDVTARNGDGQHLLHQLEHLGLLNGSSFGSMASGRIEVSQLDQLAHIHGLGFARESAMTTSAGSVNNQADYAEQTNDARRIFAVDGSGLRIGVISDSFNTSGNAINMKADIRSGDLPVDTRILLDSAHGTDEGRGMAQIVHDLAPGAAIDFSTGNNGQAGFANAILNLAAAGDRVIVDDLAYFSELYYQDGVIAQAVDQVAAQGVAYFSAAGNSGYEGLEQLWTSGAKVTIGGRAETLMRFANGQDYLPVTLAQAETIVLHWDQPGASAGGAACANDLDLFLADANGNVVAASTDNNKGGDPFEGLFGLSGGSGQTYYLYVGLHSGKAPTEIKLMALGNGAPVDLATTAGNFNDGTVYGHSAAVGGSGVAAAPYWETPAYGADVPKVEDFSSGGPVYIWYDVNGNRLAQVDERSAPIFTAPQNGDTTFFGSDSDGNGLPNFSGTSAAAPAAAAAAALMFGVNPGLTPDDIRYLLYDSTIDMDNPDTNGFDGGYDYASGGGLIQADAAVAYAQSLIISSATNFQLLGTHFGDRITGGNGANLLQGLGGADVLVGGFGSDTLVGGADADVFGYYNALETTNAAPDYIADLTNADFIDLHFIDANTTVAGDQAFTLVKKFGAHTYKEGQLTVKYDSVNGVTLIQGDINNDHKADFTILAAGDVHTFNHFVL